MPYVRMSLSLHQSPLQLIAPWRVCRKPCCWINLSAWSNFFNVLNDREKNTVYVGIGQWVRLESRLYFVDDWISFDQKRYWISALTFKQTDSSYKKAYSTGYAIPCTMGLQSHPSKLPFYTCTTPMKIHSNSWTWYLTTWYLNLTDVQ